MVAFFKDNSFLYMISNFNFFTGANEKQNYVFLVVLFMDFVVFVLYKKFGDENSVNQVILSPIMVYSLQSRTPIASCLIVTHITTSCIYLSKCYVCLATFPIALLPCSDLSFPLVLFGFIGWLAFIFQLFGLEAMISDVYGEPMLRVKCNILTCIMVYFLQIVTWIELFHCHLYHIII